MLFLKSFAKDFMEKLSAFFSFWVQLLGPLLILTATVLISFVIYTYFAYLLPLVAPSGVGHYLHLVIAGVLIVNIAFNYYSVVTTPPGFPPDREEVDGEEVAALRSAPAPRRGEGWARWCRRCDNLKPERAHHCHVCGTCVLRMDHHCPWISNCVGYANHRFFFLFVYWLWLGCGYVALLASGPAFFAPAGSSTHYFIHLSFLLTISILFSLGILLGWHIYLVLTGQTTIEFMYNKLQARDAKRRGVSYRNPFDLGWRKNFLLFFGVRQWWLFALPNRALPPGNGVSYPKFDQE